MPTRTRNIRVGDRGEAADYLDAEAVRLETEAKTLRKAAMLLRRLMAPATPEIAIAHELPLREQARRGTQVQRVFDYLMTHGPTSANVLIEKVPVPRGTLYGIFRRYKGRFEINEGRWGLVTLDESEKEGEREAINNGN